MRTSAPSLQVELHPFQSPKSPASLISNALPTLHPQPSQSACHPHCSFVYLNTQSQSFDSLSVDCISRKSKGKRGDTGGKGRSQAVVLTFFLDNRSGCCLQFVGNGHTTSHSCRSSMQPWDPRPVSAGRCRLT